MSRKNRPLFIVVMALFVLAILVVIPVDRGIVGHKGMQLGLDLQGGTHLVYQADLSEIESGKETEALDGAIAVIEKRVDILGVTSPLIQRLGEDRIVVELPGIGKVGEAKKLIGQTALLEFGERVADDSEEARWTNVLGKWKPATAIIDGKEETLSSAFFKENTYVSRDDFGRIQLMFEWDKTGSELSKKITGRLMNKRLGIFMGDESLLDDNGQPIAPVVRAQITHRGQIEGLSYSEATELSKLLNAGRIPVPLTSIYEQTISPILGAGFIDMSLKAGIIGLILVLVFMMVAYRLPGVMASGALIFYIAVVMSLFKLIPVTLNLAGVGGFVLSIGMAVDANVLIFERMKEELRLGRTLGAAIEAGFNRAWPAIRDSNITTFIACGILYWLGSSIIASAPVMGFAVTLFLGVAISMFSAVVVTRTFLRVLVGTRLAQKSSLFKIYWEKGK
ncbi:MAG: protein translocase subunit SecD [Dehalococcoidales bacterium]|nr:protein translocase subunit SecD [Dehalococcoidales bacterium]